MNNQYVEPKTRPTKRNSLLGIPRPIAGAIIGFTIFMLVTSPYFLLYLFPNSSVLLILSFFDAVLLAPGLLALFIFGSFLGSLGFENSLFFVFVFGASSVPSIIIGYLIGSHERNWRQTGIIFLVLYVLSLVFGSTFWLNLWSA